MRGYDLFLLILAASGVVSLGAGDLMIALMFSIIGIPVAMLIAILPGLALTLCLARILELAFLRRMLPIRSWSGVASVGLVLAMLAGVSLAANAKQHAELVALQADDHDSLPRPLPDQRLGYLTDQPDPSCTDFCQRLLLTGQATAVLVAHTAATVEPPDPATPALLWRFKEGTPCPPVSLPVAAARMRIADEPMNADAPRADLLIGSQIAAGRCLIGTPATLAEADAVIVVVPLRKPAWDPGFSLGGDLIGATRYAVWGKTDQGLAELARWTYVSAEKMFPLAVPLVYPGLNTKTRVGFARSRATGFAYDPGFDTFASTTLGLRLDLTEVAAASQNESNRTLLQVLQRPGALDSNTLQLADAKVQAMSQWGTPTEADRALFAQLFGDPRVPLQFWYEGAAANLMRDAPVDFTAAVAKSGFARLHSLLLPDLQWSGMSYVERNAVLKQVHPIRAEIGTIGSVLAHLPDSALLPYGPAIFALARDRENRTEPYQLLIHLGAFGEPGARALVDLLADADAVDPHVYGNDRRWQQPYLAALIGLCKMGAAASPMLPDVLKLVNSGEVKLSGGPYGRLAAATLIRLGQPADTIPALAAREEYPISGADLDRAVANSRKPDACGF